MNFWQTLATVGPIGLAKKAPGTFGSIPGVFLGIVIHHSYQAAQSVWQFGLIAFLSLLFFAVSLYAIHRTEKDFFSHDDKRIVIDEVVGQALATAFVPSHVLWIGLSFLLFRIFDIVKPWPIRLVDQKMPGAWGTMLDDVLAGVATVIVCCTLQHFFVV